MSTLVDGMHIFVGSVSSSSTLEIMMVAFPASLSALSFSLTPACPGQYTHRIFPRWISNVDTCQSGLPIPLFTFCSRLFEPRSM